MENSLYMDSNHTINKFISDVFTTIKSQEDITSYDFLTGLPLRTLGEKQIACAVQDHSGCLAFVDMDNLKKINDVHGHKAGDRALMTLGKLLARFASNGYACRLGGDEFLLFFPDITHEEASEHITQLFQQFHALTKDDAEIQYASLSAGLYMCSGNEPSLTAVQKPTMLYIMPSKMEKISFPSISLRSTICPPVCPKPAII